MMALEEKFGMDLDEEQAVNITTVQQAADLIAEQVCILSSFSDVQLSVCVTKSESFAI
jgi:hypothetical protein